MESEIGKPHLTSPKGRNLAFISELSRWKKKFGTVVNYKRQVYLNYRIE
jgi:hypothetical protein